MRRIALLTRLLLLLASCSAFAARADGVEVREAAVRATEEGLVLNADFDFELTPRLADVVANGVPLYFRVDFELTRRRWYWFDENTASRRLQLRLAHVDLVGTGAQDDEEKGQPGPQGYATHRALPHACFWINA